MATITIAGKTIGEHHPPFTIAEVGINHNGSLERAIEMIGVAKAAGADAVKFQTFKARELVGSADHLFTYRSQGKEITESMLAMFERNELPASAWKRLRTECDAAGIAFMSTPQNISDLELLLDAGISAIKVGSDDFTNLPLLRAYVKHGIPLILSCGMSNLSEVYTSLDAVGALDGAPVALLLCTSQYPTPPSDVNIRKLGALRAAFPDLVLGFSDHTQDSTAACLAVAFGARVFEKHFTLDRNLPGPDHWFSEDPQGLTAWTRAIRDGHEMLGNALVRPTAVESKQRGDFRRMLVAAAPIAAGEQFDANNIMMRRNPAATLSAAMYDTVLGKTAKRPFKAGEPIEL